jgi:subtilisin family serine protease
VGATDPHGPGTLDDTAAPFSNEGKIIAAAPGVNIPVRIKDGHAVNADGTSFSSPIMAETAYEVSSVNPKLSLDRIQQILTDPRVAHDIPGTDRDGAGVVDPFAAALVAKNPRITGAQIDSIRRMLDENPGKRFDLLSDGTLRAH